MSDDYDYGLMYSLEEEERHQYELDIAYAMKEKERNEEEARYRRDY